MIPTVENLAKLLHGSSALTSILEGKKLAVALNGHQLHVQEHCPDSSLQRHKKI